MRQSCCVLGLIMLALAGCTHLQLERSTVNQATTLTDLQYKQVLNNLAMLSRNPGAMPYFALAGQGQTQITDTGSNTDTVIPNAAHPGIWSGNYGLTGSRAVQENWTMTPILDPDKLKRMRCAYLLALGCTSQGCEDCVAKMQDFFCADECHKTASGDNPDPSKCGHCLQCAIPQGWFVVGCKHDVPERACYVGRYGNTYVWVLPEGVEGLTRFTLSILDLATTTSHADSAQVVRVYTGDPKTAPLTRTEVTTKEPPPVAAGQAPRPTIRVRTMPFLLQTNVPPVPTAPR